MMRATELAHLIMRQTIKPGDAVVDATVGNGHDTLFLAELVGPSGQVLGFDVQESALQETGKRVAGLSQVTLFHSGHENLSEKLATTVPAISHDGLAAAMFNLGYLPGAAKIITTHAETTLQGLEQALSCLKVQGVVTLVCYPGHSGGAEETAAVQSYAERLSSDFAVSRYHRVNTTRAAPQLLIIQRLRKSGV